MTRKEFIEFEKEYGFEYAVSELPTPTISREAVEEEVQKKIDIQDYDEADYISAILKRHDSDIFIIDEYRNYKPVYDIHDVEMYFEKGE